MLEAGCLLDSVLVLADGCWLLYAGCLLNSVWLLAAGCMTAGYWLADGNTAETGRGRPR